VLKDVEFSLYRFIRINFSTVYNYNVNYGSVNYKSEGLDEWIDISFAEFNIESKQDSFAQADFYTRIQGSNNYVVAKKLAIERFIAVMRKASVPLYDYTDINNPVLDASNKILIQNNQGRFAVNRVVFDIPSEMGLHRSTVYFNVTLLTDKSTGLSL